MHFGRVDDLTGIELTLPPDAPRTQTLLGLDWKGKGNLHVGCPVWASQTWVGSLYPSATKPADFLASYAEQLGTVEVNSTFYHLLDTPRITAWRKSVPPSFRFCPKMFRGISENLGSSEIPALVQQCAQSFAAFGDTLGLAFMQLPERFGPEHLSLLKRMLALWPRELKLAVEFRHPAWFDAHVLLDEAVNLLYRHGAATVITDTPGRRDVLHTSLAQPRVLIRFQGHELAPEDQQRLQAWSERIIGWAACGLEDIYFFCHQPDDALIPRTVNLLLQAMQMRGVIEPAPWRDFGRNTRSARRASSESRAELF